jgi:hypothetical protein
MISSTTSTERTARPEILPVSSKASARAQEVHADQISTDNAAFLKSALSRQPAVRPEVVARARALAADPSYPPPAALRKVAELILAAPDLTEDES